MARKFRKRRFSRRRKTGRMTAAKVRSIVLGTAEKKSFDTTYDADGPVAGTSVCIPLTLCSEGVGDDERIGDYITPKSLQFKCSLLGNATTDDDTLARIVIVREDNSEGVVPNITEILKQDTVDSLRNYQQGGQFRIIWDKTFRLIKQGIQATRQFMIFNKYIRLPKTSRCQYIGSGRTQADLGKGHYYAVLMCAQPNTEQCTWGLTCRLVYTDV